VCDTCGCGETNSVKILKPGEFSEQHATTTDAETGHHHHPHNHPHPHPHEHDHTHGEGRRVEVEQDVLAANNLLAERNRGYLEAKGILALNLVSSPGSGKTTLLEKTLGALKEEFPLYVVEGDQQTTRDAARIDALQVPVVQVNTGTGCHLDADMLAKAFKALPLGEGGVLFIENVGNLVCPALFDLGEWAKVVVISVTEGEDKPQKYPHMFAASQLVLINKIDLLPYVDFNIDRCKKYALQVNHHLQFIELSARTGEGLEQWLDWIRHTHQQYVAGSH